MAQLELRPNCELCNRDLPPNSSEARICSYECTYCSDCVDKVLHNVCPTCGGNFALRPIRPAQDIGLEKELGLAIRPASTRRVHTPFSMTDVIAHVSRIRDLEPDSASAKINKKPRPA